MELPATQDPASAHQTPAHTVAAALELRSLRRSFQGRVVVEDVSLTVPPGQVLGLLGPNGAGKSTLISMLSGLLAPTSGECFIGGHSVQRAPALALASLGVVPQDVALYPDLGVRENLEFFGRMYGLGGPALRLAVDANLETIGLAARQRDRVGTLSGGMKRRVNIAAALLHKPAVVVMDEPTVGIDPQSRRHILDSVKALNRAGTTVLYTTHHMEEAQELSHRIAIMDQGRLIALGTHQELLAKVGQHAHLVLGLAGTSAALVDAWRRVPGVVDVVTAETSATVVASDSNQVLPRLFDAANAAGVRIASVSIQEPSLETVFLVLTGRALRDP